MQTIRCGSSPVLVHCTAGVGRTGVLITIDVALTMVEHDVKVYRPLFLVVVVVVVRHAESPFFVGLRLQVSQTPTPEFV